MARLPHEAMTRVPLAEAEAVADDVIALLRPVCERIAVAGAIRRRRPAVKDLELVVIPKVERVSLDLFGERLAEVDLLDAAVLDWVDQGLLQPRLDRNGLPRMGPRAKLLSYGGVNVDLFAVLPPAQWGWVVLLRTGPATWNIRLVTSQLQGGLLPPGLCSHEGALRRRDYWGRPGEVVPTPEEPDAFAALGLAWVEPESRR